ncbi:hypothetical protein E3N88_13589 [Mikania micrantha]|uniref:Uncharacterized protein n=1 Tax=Mikania micrantha TaxID=192012 RepID=A0A5N6P8Z7_9ASTR|nr:hypothetical protein E3N88_13589 [Mikania micrantha]
MSCEPFIYTFTMISVKAIRQNLHFFPIFKYSEANTAFRLTGRRLMENYEDPTNVEQDEDYQYDDGKDYEDEEDCTVADELIEDARVERLSVMVSHLVDRWLAAVVRWMWRLCCIGLGI